MRQIAIALGCIAAWSCGSDSPSQPSPTPPPTTTPTPPPQVSLTGTVSASTGARIAGATVSIPGGTNAGRTTTTNATGEFRIDNLTQGSATVEARAAGYETQTRNVDINGTNTVAFSMTALGARTTFGPGSYRIGTGSSDIAAGRYFTDPPTDACYWERRSNGGTDFAGIITNDFVGFNALQLIVDIAATDHTFTTDADCGTWFNTPRQPGQTSSIPPGTWLVHTQIRSGVYRSTVSVGCYWERLRAFSGSISDINDNDFVATAGPQTIEIAASDVGFHSDADCGTWALVPGLTSSSTKTRSASSRSDINMNRELNRQQHPRR